MVGVAGQQHGRVGLTVLGDPLIVGRVPGQPLAGLLVLDLEARVVDQLGLVRLGHLLQRETVGGDLHARVGRRLVRVRRGRAVVVVEVAVGGLRVLFVRGGRDRHAQGDGHGLVRVRGDQSGHVEADAAGGNGQVLLVGDVGALGQRAGALHHVDEAGHVRAVGQGGPRGTVHVGLSGRRVHDAAGGLRAVIARVRGGEAQAVGGILADGHGTRVRLLVVHEDLLGEFDRLVLDDELAHGLTVEVDAREAGAQDHGQALRVGHQVQAVGHVDVQRAGVRLPVGRCGRGDALRCGQGLREPAQRAGVGHLGDGASLVVAGRHADPLRRVRGLFVHLGDGVLGPRVRRGGADHVEARDLAARLDDVRVGADQVGAERAAAQRHVLARGDGDALGRGRVRRACAQRQSAQGGHGRRGGGDFMHY